MAGDVGEPQRARVVDQQPSSLALSGPVVDPGDSRLTHPDRDEVRQSAILIQHAQCRVAGVDQRDRGSTIRRSTASSSKAPRQRQPLPASDAPGRAYLANSAGGLAVRKAGHRAVDAGESGGSLEIPRRLPPCAGRITILDRRFRYAQRAE